MSMSYIVREMLNVVTSQRHNISCKCSNNIIYNSQHILFQIKNGFTLGNEKPSKNK